MNERFEVSDAVPSAAGAARADAAGPFGGPGGPGFARPRFEGAGRKGQRALWFGVAAATAVVTIAGVGLPQVGWLAAQTATTTWTARHPVTAVQLYVSGGDVTVRPIAGSAPVSLRQTLTWTVNKPQVNETWQGDTLMITEDCAAPSFTVVNPCGAPLDLAVPAGVSVESTVDSGALTIRRMTGSVNVRAQSGDIELDDDSGTLWARADSGSVTGNRLASTQVTAQTLSGDVELDFASAPDSVSASVSSGSLRVTLPRGTSYRVSGQTASGDRQIDPGIQDESSSRQITANTISGDVSIGFPGAS